MGAFPVTLEDTLHGKMEWAVFPGVWISVAKIGGIHVAW
jgi:hypothetical protein